MHTIRKNTWNVILVLDLSLTTSLETITQQVSHMIQRGVPVRFGVVPMYDASINDICESNNRRYGTDDSAHQMARLYYYCVNTFGRSKTQQLLAEVRALLQYIDLTW